MPMGFFPLGKTKVAPVDVRPATAPIDAPTRVGQNGRGLRKRASGTEWQATVYAPPAPARIAPTRNAFVRQNSDSSSHQPTAEINPPMVRRQNSGGSHRPAPIVRQGSNSKGDQSPYAQPQPSPSKSNSAMVIRILRDRLRRTEANYSIAVAENGKLRKALAEMQVWHSWVEMFTHALKMVPPCACLARRWSSKNLADVKPLQ